MEGFLCNFDYYKEWKLPSLVTKNGLAEQPALLPIAQLVGVYPYC
jgi:hypothetical protein